MSVTTRLVTLQPPGAALDGVLDALHAAARTPGTSTTVGQADRMPKPHGQPDGARSVFELVSESDAGAVGHGRFTEAAGRSLTACGVPWAWQFDEGPWQYGT
jgi:hypothetical protein